MPEDDIRSSLQLLERPVAPPPGLANALFDRLMEELDAEARGVAPPAVEPPRVRPRGVRRPGRRRLTLIAAALAVVPPLVAGLLVVLPQPQSAFPLGQQAR